MTRKATQDPPQHISRAPTVPEKGLRVIFFCQFSCNMEKNARDMDG